ncbi:MAG: GNAT family N-acetyltransferase [Gammaproteobacteria bacterium RBG_16_66_13]|nr:MAG: GNAT family N-acetyltransferase [Gammaproteobacteria bacterium RBG_16_66_13]
MHLHRRSESDRPSLPTLTTARLVLRPFTLADVPDVQRLAGDREIASTSLHIPHPYPDGVAEQWISTHKDRFVRDEAAVFAVTRADTGEVIGANGLEIRRDHARAEMGYWIGKAFWNQGCATEAGREVLRFAFEDLQLERVFAEHFKRNPASGRVMQKLGMTREGELRRHIKKWGVREDIVIYAILRSEFSHQDEGARSASTG